MNQIKKLEPEDLAQFADRAKNGGYEYVVLGTENVFGATYFIVVKRYNDVDGVQVEVAHFVDATEAEIFCSVMNSKSIITVQSEEHGHIVYAAAKIVFKYRESYDQPQYDESEVEVVSFTRPEDLIGFDD